MNREAMMKNRHFLLGATTTVGIVALSFLIIGFLLVRVGVAPTNADAMPSALESNLLTAALRASISRNAARQNWVAGKVTNDDLIDGSQIYESLCAQCHGHLNGRATTLGSAFYPPAPDLHAHPTSYSESELFWVVKHGIRNTGMPSWSRLLSDDDIRKVVAVLRRIDSLPPDVREEAKSESAKTDGDRQAHGAVKGSQPFKAGAGH
jgi:mono/diheme cytochrome c family protein